MLHLLVGSQIDKNIFALWNSHHNFQNSIEWILCVVLSQDLDTLHDRTMDPALSVRKQAMVSITALLTENPDSSLLHG
jgi:hypothetical protein